jgi:RecA-family ATPase
MAINILKAFVDEPPELDFVLPGMIAGTVGGIVSPGGAGKTMFMLQIAAQIAGGNPTLGLGDLKTGSVVYLAAEDPEPALLHRVHAIGAITHARLWETVAENLGIEPLTGYAPNIDKPEWQDFIKTVATGQRLLVLDTLRRFHQLDENDSGAMSSLLAFLEYVTKETGCSIVFAHHASKAAAMGGMGDAQQAARGSSVLTDNVRWQSFLVTMSKQESGLLRDPLLGTNHIGKGRGSYVRFGVSKSNYGAPIDEQWYRRGKGGVLEPVELLEAIDDSKKAKGGNRDEL